MQWNSRAKRGHGAVARILIGSAGICERGASFIPVTDTAYPAHGLGRTAQVVMWLRQRKRERERERAAEQAYVIVYTV